MDTNTHEYSCPFVFIRGVLITTLTSITLMSFENTSHAADYTYAPDDCDFHMTFPEQPAKGKACDAKNPKDCHLVSTYTKIFDVSTGLRINVTCGPAEKNMLQKYDGKVMEYTLAAISKEHIDPAASQAAFEDHGTAKQAILMGSKKQEDGSETVYMSQLWIGQKSVMTIEGEVTGTPLPEADNLFAQIMKSVTFTSASGPAAAKPDTAAANNAKPVEKSEQKPAEKSEKP